MAKAKVLLDYDLILVDRYKALIKVYEIEPNKKFPTGYKVRCTLLDLQENTICLLLDNHEPYGYHLHTDLPANKEVRKPVDVKDYESAIKIFFVAIKKVIHEK